jgi:hypothetical protein
MRNNSTDLPQCPSTIASDSLGGGGHKEAGLALRDLARGHISGSIGLYVVEGAPRSLDRLHKSRVRGTL